MNNPLNRFRLPIIALLSTAALGLAGCGGEPEPEPTAEPSASVEPVTRPLPAADRREGPPVRMATGPQIESLPSATEGRYQVVPKVEGQLEEEGEGLDLFLDASSEAAFRRSLNDVAASTSAEQYAELERSIRFLIAYDPTVLGSAERLHATIDGLTGAEVIARAKEIARVRMGNTPNRDG